MSAFIYIFKLIYFQIVIKILIKCTFSHPIFRKILKSLNFTIVLRHEIFNILNCILVDHIFIQIFFLLFNVILGISQTNQFLVLKHSCYDQIILKSSGIFYRKNYLDAI